MIVMIETLLVYTFLLESELASRSEYEEHLNALFEESPSHDLLLSLQWLSFDAKEIKKMIDDYFKKYEIDHRIFGSFLMKKLRAIYRQNNIELQTFNSKVVSIWGKLPENLMQTEPFWTMSYAGEPLLWGDIKQTQELYERMLTYYKC